MLKQISRTSNGNSMTYMRLSLKMKIIFFGSSFRAVSRGLKPHKAENERTHVPFTSLSTCTRSSKQHGQQRTDRHQGGSGIKQRNLKRQEFLFYCINWRTRSVDWPLRSRFFFVIGSNLLTTYEVKNVWQHSLFLQRLKDVMIQKIYFFNNYFMFTRQMYRTLSKGLSLMCLLNMVIVENKI